MNLFNFHTRTLGDFLGGGDFKIDEKFNWTAILGNEIRYFNYFSPLFLGGGYFGEKITQNSHRS